MPSCLSLFIQDVVSDGQYSMVEDLEEKLSEYKSMCIATNPLVLFREWSCGRDNWCNQGHLWAVVLTLLV